MIRTSAVSVAVSAALSVGGLIALESSSAQAAEPKPVGASATAASRGGNGVQAARVQGWGTSTDGDEFEGTAVDTRKWFAYVSAGHAGNGLRRAEKLSVGNGMLTISGDSAGTTGGMGFRHGYKYGRWETRMRVPAGDARYHPVSLLWPDAEDWPVGGEIDYAETTAASSDVYFFLHYSSANQQTYAKKAVDLTEWHNYAVEWSPSGIRGYVDGELFFTDTNASHLPPRPMHQSLQLDWFPKGSTATTPSTMQVAWNRYYPL